jgi:hypothetical protein
MSHAHRRNKHLPQNGHQNRRIANNAEAKGSSVLGRGSHGHNTFNMVTYFRFLSSTWLLNSDYWSRRGAD